MPVTSDLEGAFRAALQAVHGGTVVESALREEPLPGGSVSLLAVGKAAAAMAGGAVRSLGGRLHRGLVVTREGYAGGLPGDARLRVLESAHPVPDRRSIAAGEALIDFIVETPRDEPLLVLLSGGTSSLVEVPVPGLDLARLAELNERLLAEGHDIATVNAARKSLSRIKGGRLGYWLDGRQARVLAISDVQGDAPHVIGSGLLAPDPEPPALPADLADRVRALSPAPNPAPVPDDPCLAGVTTRVVADNALAREAAAGYLRRLGYRVRLPSAFLGGDVAAVAEALVAEMRRPRSVGEVAIWGAEPTVVLPSRPGRGGRMHALAAAVARALAGETGWALCAAGTDGADGNAGHAGAIVDAERAGRVSPAEMDGCLRRADTAVCLERMGATVDTGPTGTNVMDVVVARGVSNQPFGEHE